MIIYFLVEERKVCLRFLKSHIPEFLIKYKHPWHNARIQEPGLADTCLQPFFFRFPGLYISPLAWWMLRIFWSCCSRLTLMSMLWMMTCAPRCFTPLSQTICMLLAFFLTTVCKDTGTISLGYLLRNSTPFYCQLYLFYDVSNYLYVSCKKYDWRDQHLCKFIGTKESVYIRKEFNSHRTSLGHQHGRRDVMCKRSIMCRLQPHAWSFSSLACFARQTKKKERLHVVYE